MRRVFTFPSFVLLLALSLPSLANAQALAIHQAVTPTTATTPAKATASAIIPGSPLAALTGVGTPASSPDNDDNGPSPFGTDALGLSVTDLISHEAAGTIGEFLTAVRKSTELTPVWQWLQSFPTDPERREHAGEIAAGLAMTVLPAWVIAVLIRLGLARPRTGLVKRAARLRQKHAATEDAPEYTKHSEGLAAAEAGEIEAHPLRRDSVLAWGHRLFLAILHLLLSLLPIVGFGLTVGLLLGAGLITSRQAHLSIVGVSNAYLFCRISLEVVRFLIAPTTPPLRLFNITDPGALWFTKWVRIMLATGGFSYGIISISDVLGLPDAGVMALTRNAVLVIHIELAIMVWRGRKVVGGWIRGKPDAENMLASSRGRLAAVWHYLALFYILALWVAWAGGVQNAFGLLLRVVVFFAAAIVLGRMAWVGSERLLERMFPDPKASSKRRHSFFIRARAYNPLIRTVLRLLIGIVVVIVILLGWGINALPWLLTDPVSRSLISAFVSILITVAIALILWEIANGFMNGRIDRLTSAGKTRQALRLRTLAPILKATIGTAIGLVAGLICLSKIGVNAAPLLAGAGVLGIAIGFGSQKLVQDIITGLFLLLEDTMQVGDVVTLAGMSGTVERLSIRTIRLRGGDGSVNIIPFSAVTTVTNQTRDFGYAQISIGVAYEENIDRVCAVLTDIAHTMRAEPTWSTMMRDDLQINGLDQFGASALMITGQIRTGPGQHWAVRREFNRRMVIRFAEEHIEIPYTYLPPAPPLVEPPAVGNVEEGQETSPSETPSKG
jgi:moderate conductance mechanosensitive channel